MSFKQPKVQQAVATPPPTPNLADAENRQQTERRKRLASGGRNATFLASVIPDSASSGSAAPVKTLTGLQG